MFIFDPENIFLSALLVLNITWGEEQTGRYVKAQGLSKLWPIGDGELASFSRALTGPINVFFGLGKSEHQYDAGSQLELSSVVI